MSIAASKTSIPTPLFQPTTTATYGLSFFNSIVMTLRKANPAIGIEAVFVDLPGVVAEVHSGQRQKSEETANDCAAAPPCDEASSTHRTTNDQKEVIYDGTARKHQN